MVGFEENVMREVEFENYCVVGIIRKGFIKGIIIW